MSVSNQDTEQNEMLLDGDPSTSGMRFNATRLLGSWRTAGIAIPFLILFIILSISSGPFLHTTNLINILDQQASTLCIAAAGTLVLVAGGIDLSVGATYGLSTVIAGEIALHHSPVLAILAAIAAGLLIGLVNGLIVTVLRSML
jgi:ribose transport system permease protein